MREDLAAQFLSAIITRNSGQRVEDDVKEALAYAETFERLTADYTTPPFVEENAKDWKLEFENGGVVIEYTTSRAAVEVLKNPTLDLSKEKEWSVKFNNTFADFYTQDFRNDLLRSFLSSYAKCEKVTFLVAANNGILSTWEDKKRILGFYGEEKDILVLSCFTETEVKQKIDAYYEERGGFAKHVEYLKSIGQW